MKKQLFVFVFLILLCVSSSYALSIFTTLETASGLDEIPLYNELNDPNSKYWDVKKGTLIEIINKINDNILIISTSYGYVGQLNPSDLNPDFLSSIIAKIDSLPAEEKRVGIVTKARPNVYKEILAIANRLYKHGDDELLYYLRRWDFKNDELISAEAYNYKALKENQLPNTGYPCDEITARTPYSNALLHCWSKKNNFSEPTEKELYKYFKKPQYMVIDAKFYVGSIDSGKYIMGAINKNGKIIRPIEYELDNIADTSSFWPNYPAYKANNTYYFEMSKVLTDEVIEFITNGVPPFSFKIDPSKIK